MDQELQRKSKIIRSILFVVFLLFLIILTIYLFPKFIELRYEETRLEVKEYIESIGFWGWLIALGVQVLQVVIAFLPGEPVEIAMGMVFGPIGGMLTCMLGIIIGTFIIYLLAKTIGMKFISIFINPEKLNEYKFINNATKKDMLVFTVYFIPGTPKDVITYFAPFIKMPMMRFILISTFARTPSIISSTLLGDSIGEGKWGLAIIIFASTLVIAGIGILINRWYMKKHQDTTEEQKEHI
jgi:uncharacterized membrane protein YdjX (TVP38/TMEM64 family)